jgi:hypothetical protein
MPIDGIINKERPNAIKAVKKECNNFYSSFILGSCIITGTAGFVNALAHTSSNDCRDFFI